MSAVAGILESLAAAAIWETGRRAWLRMARRNYAGVFGVDATGGRLYIAMGALEPPPVVDERGNRLLHVFPKAGLPGTAFSASQVVSNCEVRAAKYLIESVAVNAGNWSVITTDAEIKDQHDLSFVSIGLLNNLKTVQLLANTTNTLVTFSLPRFLSKASGRSLIENVNATHDHGLILKIHPSSQPQKTWICCSGLGEWGTSGAAWYLSRRWRDIHAKFKNQSFAIIVRVEAGRDESAEPVVQGSTPQEIDRFARG
jgi:hypothetical protein